MGITEHDGSYSSVDIIELPLKDSILRNIILMILA